jgi:hypothetical protein
MASVFIDIPGIGTVEAKNAATESTLRELLKAMQGKGGSKGKKGGADDIEETTEEIGRLGKTAGAFGKGLGTMVRYTGMVVGGFDSLAKATTGIIQQFANVGDSVESAAAIFKGVPVVGTMFTAVAGAASKVTKSYNEVTQSGATFGGSIGSFSAAASKAGMTMDAYGALIARNGEAMLAFGSTTEGGAKRFGDVSKALRSAGSDLYALGYSTKDINEGLANYGKQLRLEGRQGKQTNAELAQGAKNYLKEMDALAKVTGESRKEQEAARERLVKDGQFAAASAGLNKDVADSMANMVNSMPTQNLKDFAKDVLSSGSATTENSRKLAAAFPELYQQLQRQHQQTQSNIKISDQERNSTLNNMKAEGKATMERNKAAYRSSEELASTSADVAASQRLNIDATKDSIEEQKNAAAKTDGMNEKMQKAQETLAAFSNSFQMALANSGLLDLLMKSFELAAGLVMTYVVPAFNIIAAIVTKVGGILIDTLTPAFEFLGGFLANTVYPAFQSIAEFILIDFLPSLMGAAENLYNFFEPALSLIGTVISDYLWPAFKGISTFILDNAVPIIAAMGVALAAYTGYQLATAIPALIATIPPMLAMAAGMWAIVSPLLLAVAPFIAVGLAIGALVLWFKKLGGDTQVISDAFSWMGLKFKDMFLALKEGIFSLLNKIPGMRGDFDNDLQEIKQEREENAKKREDIENGISNRMANNVQAAKDEELAKKAQADAKEDKRRQLHEATDLKNLKAKSQFGKGLETANDKASAAQKEKESLDYNAGPAELLKQYAKQEGSAFIKDQKPAAADADAAKTGIVNDAEVKKQADAKATADADAAKKSSSGAGPAAQESPSTLLASLNTKMDQLIKINKNVFDVAESQLGATKGLSGNLFKQV